MSGFPSHMAGDGYAADFGALSKVFDNAGLPTLQYIGYFNPLAYVKGDAITETSKANFCIRKLVFDANGDVIGKPIIKKIGRNNRFESIQESSP